MNRKWIPFILVLVILVSMGAFLRDYGLVYDSRALLSRHPVVSGRSNPLEAFSRPYLDRLGDDRGLKTYYRPLPLLSFRVGRQVWGLSPAAERFCNLILFFAWLCLVYSLVYIREKERWTAAAVMLLCAAYPLNWDNVAWVAGRPDMLMLVFGTAALLLLERERGSPRLNRAGALFCFVLAMFSKETAFFFLPLLALPMGRSREPGWITRGLLVLLSLGTLVLRHGATGFWGVPGTGSMEMGAQILRLLGALGVYARSLLLPFGVSPYLPPEWVPGTTDLVLGVLAALASGWLVYRWFAHREERLPLSLLLIFVGGHLLTVFSALSIAVAPRFMIVPFFGAAWWLLKKGGARRRVTRLTVVLLVIVFLPFVPLQASAYRDNLTYWLRAHQEYPDSSHFSLQLAREYVGRGRFLDGETVLAGMQPLSNRERGDLELLRANVDLARADYPSLCRRLDRLTAGHPDRAAAAAAVRLRSRMTLLTGDADSALSMMRELIQGDPRAEWVRELHRMLLGRCRWADAEALEAAFRLNGVVFNPRAETVARRFQRMSPQERAEYFTLHWNPRGALAILEALPGSFSRLLGRAGMHYFAGEPETAVGLLGGLARTPEAYGKVGMWYLRHMNRPREALRWLNRSLEIKPNQPDITRIVKKLETREKRLDAGAITGGE